VFGRNPGQIILIEYSTLNNQFFKEPTPTKTKKALAQSQGFVMFNSSRT